MAHPFWIIPGYVSVFCSHRFSILPFSFFPLMLSPQNRYFEWCANTDTTCIAEKASIWASACTSIYCLVFQCICIQQNNLVDGSIGFHQISCFWCMYCDSNVYITFEKHTILDPSPDNGLHLVKRFFRLDSTGFGDNPTESNRVLCRFYHGCPSKSD